MKRSMLDDNDDDHCVVIASPPLEIGAELAKAYITLPFYPERCPKLILISGKYDTGKDTLALALKKYFEIQGMHVQHEKFADALKEAAAIITGERKVDQYTDEGKAKMIDSLGMTIGRFQQVYGTVLRQHVNPDIWVHPLMKKAFKERSINGKPVVTIVSDCRFPNEADAGRARGGAVIRLNRKNARKDAHGRDPNHVSETALDNYEHFDLVIDNDGTRAEMVRKAIWWLTKTYMKDTDGHLWFSDRRDTDWMSMAKEEGIPVMDYLSVNIARGQKGQESQKEVL